MRPQFNAVASVPGKAKILAALHLNWTQTHIISIATPALECEWSVPVAPGTDLIDVAPDGVRAIVGGHLQNTIQIIDLTSLDVIDVDIQASVYQIEAISSEWASILTSGGLLDIDMRSGAPRKAAKTRYPPECIWLKRAFALADLNQRVAIFQEHIAFSELSSGNITDIIQLGERRTVGLAPLGVPHPIDPLKIARIVQVGDSEALASFPLPTFIAGDHAIRISDFIVLLSGQNIAQVNLHDHQVSYYASAALPSLGDPNDLAYDSRRGLFLTVVDFEVRAFGPWAEGVPALEPGTDNTVPAFRITPADFKRPGKITYERVSDSLVAINFELQKGGPSRHIAIVPLDGGQPASLYPTEELLSP